MSQFFAIHQRDPQPRLIRQAVQIIENGGLIVYPTDSCYALGCHLGNKEAMLNIRRIRELDDNHDLTLVCRDLSEIAAYAKVDNTVFRLLKSRTPGPYTFLLKATHEVPRRLQTPKRRTIGLRVPENPIARMLLQELDQPLMSSTLLLPGEERAQTDPQAIRARLEHVVDLVIDGGFCGPVPTTVIDLTTGKPEVIRQGKGDIAWLQAS